MQGLRYLAACAAIIFPTGTPPVNYRSLSKYNSELGWSGTYVYVSDLRVCDYLRDSCRGGLCGDRDEVENATWKTRLMEDLGKKVMSSGCVLGTLEYNSISTNDWDGDGPDC